MRKRGPSGKLIGIVITLVCGCGFGGYAAYRHFSAASAQVAPQRKQMSKMAVIDEEDTATGKSGSVVPTASPAVAIPTPSLSPIPTPSPKAMTEEEKADEAEKEILEQYQKNKATTPAATTSTSVSTRRSVTSPTATPVKDRFAVSDRLASQADKIKLPDDTSGDGTSFGKVAIIIGASLLGLAVIVGAILAVRHWWDLGLSKMGKGLVGAVRHHGKKGLTHPSVEAFFGTPKNIFKNLALGLVGIFIALEIVAVFTRPIGMPFSEVFWVLVVYNFVIVLPCFLFACWLKGGGVGQDKDKHQVSLLERRFQAACMLKANATVKYQQALKKLELFPERAERFNELSGKIVQLQREINSLSRRLELAENKENASMKRELAGKQDKLEEYQADIKETGFESIGDVTKQKESLENSRDTNYQEILKQEAEILGFRSTLKAIGFEVPVPVIITDAAKPPVDDGKIKKEVELKVHNRVVRGMLWYLPRFFLHECEIPLSECDRRLARFGIMVALFVALISLAYLVISGSALINMASMDIADWPIRLFHGQLNFKLTRVSKAYGIGAWLFKMNVCSILFNLTFLLKAKAEKIIGL